MNTLNYGIQKYRLNIKYKKMYLDSRDLYCLPESNFNFKH